MTNPTDDEERDDQLQIRMSKRLKKQSLNYAKKNKVTVGALVRAFLKRLTNPNDPLPPPRETQAELKRPGRRKANQAKNLKSKSTTDEADEAEE